MRTVRLARVAAQAEILLLKRLASMAARRAVYGAVAGVFALAVLALIHVIAVLALERYAHFDPIISTAIVLAVDLVIAVLFGLLAAGKMSDPVAEEARRLRDDSIEQARQSLTLGAMLAPATRLLAQTGILRVIMRALGSGLRRSRA
jgi:cobalamin biosynthesis protein CobD/CbiB